MRFYKLRDISTNYDIYVNPKHIELYVYHKDVEYVEIRFNSGRYADIKQSDFENMMFLEGADEYWNAPHTTELQSITLIKS